MSPAAEIGIGDLPADLDAHSGIAEAVETEEQGGTVIAAQRNASGDWEGGLGRLAVKMLQDGHTDVFDALTSRFEKAVLQAALEVTRGRRVEAAQRLGIGRNTITRKLHELGIDD
jgi:two-component system nitrogen regulation response regulator GlnG